MTAKNNRGQSSQRGASGLEKMRSEWVEKKEWAGINEVRVGREEREGRAHEARVGRDWRVGDNKQSQSE